MPVKMEVVGLDQAAKNLDTLTGQIKSNIGRASLRAAAQLIVKRLVQTTYSTFQKRSGAINAGWAVRVGEHLKGDVLSSVIVEKPQAVSGFAGQLSKAQRRRAKAAADRNRVSKQQGVAYWWRFLEFGTQKRKASATPRFMRHGGKARTDRQRKSATAWAASADRGRIDTVNIAGQQRSWVRPAFNSEVRNSIETFAATMRRLTDENVNAMPKQ